MQIRGRCDERFTAVRDAFEANFAQGLEVGAVVRGDDRRRAGRRPVGRPRRPEGDGVERDTIINVYSTTKTMATVCC